MKIVLTGSLGHIGKPLAKVLVGKGHMVSVISSTSLRREEIEALGAKSLIGKMEDILYGQDSNSTYVPSEYLQAIEKSELATFSKKHWKEISDTIIGWDIIVQKIVAKQHREKLDKRSQLVSQDATTRYLEFMEKFPDLVNRVPLSYIASYLGITHSTLSRIRKKIR